ncbi:hypothetical protein [Moraxella lacunata]
MFEMGLLPDWLNFFRSCIFVGKLPPNNDKIVNIFLHFVVC